MMVREDVRSILSEHANSNSFAVDRPSLANLAMSAKVKDMYPNRPLAINLPTSQTFLNLDRCYGRYEGRLLEEACLRIFIGRPDFLRLPFDITLVKKEDIFLAW